MKKESPIENAASASVMVQNAKSFPKGSTRIGYCRNGWRLFVYVISDVLQLRPYGVDISSGVESNGQKDAQKIKKLIEEVRAYA